MSPGAHAGGSVGFVADVNKKKAEPRNEILVFQDFIGEAYSRIRRCEGSPDMDQEQMRRVCFVLQVKRDRLQEYEQRHGSVWPEMLVALRQAGWHNYSLFLRPDGLLIGYLETPDFAQALQKMAATEINQKWQTEMAGFFEGVPGRKADEQMELVPEVFHLD